MMRYTQRSFHFIGVLRGNAWNQRITALFKRASHAQVSSENQNLDFSDHKTVFKFKRTTDLLRGYFLLRICSVNMFVDNALSVMRGCERVFGEKLFSLLARPTFYRHFVGGDTEAELRATRNELAKAGIHLMVCPAFEEDAGETDMSKTGDKYKTNMEYIMEIGQIMLRAGEKDPCLQFKITAMMPGDLVTKISSNIGSSIQLDELSEKIGNYLETGTATRFAWLSEDENNQLYKCLDYINTFGEKARQTGITLLVDAEYTYMNPGISAVALGMMLAFNKERPIVWNTYQCYLKAALQTISTEMDIVEKRGSCFGAKVVRGAYMEKERKLAKMHGYPDPVNDTYEDTCAMYDRVAEYMMTHIAKVGNRCNIVLGTHNEQSVMNAASKLTDLGLDPSSGQVVFGQIYGMADQISVPLSAAGFKVYKSVPYGPLGEVLPYLSRRAAENRVVLAGARRELELLKSELKSRVTMRG